MSTTVIELATKARVPVKTLIDQLKKAGISNAHSNYSLSPEESRKVLNYLKNKTATQALNQHVEPETDRVLNRSTSVFNLKGKGTVSITKKTKPLTPANTSEEISQETIIPSQQEEKSTSTFEAEEEVNFLKEKTSSSEEQKESSIFQKDNRKTKPAIKEVKHKHKILSDVNSESEEDMALYVSKKAVKKSNTVKQTFSKPTKLAVKEIFIPEKITVPELAQKLSLKLSDTLKRLKEMGYSSDENVTLDQETAMFFVEEIGHVPKPIVSNQLERTLQENLIKASGFEKAVTRAPIITIMGHVDHGKTSLLDYIRHTKVALKEAGGITQRIGAYRVQLPGGKLTFLDTPGHAAFTAMRARGANITDIVILVVAADDGVMPQTVEAIQHAKAANVPIVVVINKIDKASANIEKVQQQLAGEHNLIPEAWGGEIPFMEVSSKEGTGIDTLLDTLLLQAELLNLKAPATGSAQGTIMEAKLDKWQGSTASVLIQQGTLKKGDFLLAGTSFGRIKAIYDENGKMMLSAGPSTPAEILGLSFPPAAGDKAIVIQNEREAKKLIEERKKLARASSLNTQRIQQPNHWIDQLDKNSRQTLNIILKTDVQGSAEAIKDALLKLSNEEIEIKFLVASVGVITESDINLAMTVNTTTNSKALILAFNISVDRSVKQLIQGTSLQIKDYRIIYELLDDVKTIAKGFLAPQVKEIVLGHATIKEIFGARKTGTIAGCIIQAGYFDKKHKIRVLRHNKSIYQGELDSLKRFQNDVQEVREGTECGIKIKNYTGLQIGDTIENYRVETVERNL